MDTHHDYDVLTIDGRRLIVTDQGRIIPCISGSSDGDAGDEGGGTEDTTAAAEAAEVAATTSEETGSGDGDTRAAGVTGEKGPVPYDRFHTRNERAKKYEELGLEPDEVRGKIQRLTELERKDAEQAERRRLAQEGESGGEGMSTEERQALRVMERLLDKLPPQAAARFLEKLGPGTARSLARLPENEKLQVEDYNAAGFREMREHLGKYDGITVTPDVEEQFESFIENEILKDANLKAAYWNPASRSKVMETAVERVITKRFNPILLAQGARTIQKRDARRATTIGRATQSGTPQAKPAEFKSKHEPGSLGHVRDRRAHRAREIDDILDQPMEDAS